MAADIVLPQWGMEMQDGVIVRWLKKEGDSVEEGEPLVEIETAKMQTELESTVAGVLDRIVAQEGDIVPIRGLLCVIAEPGEVIDRSAVASPPSPVAAPTDPIAASGRARSTDGQQVQVVPVARKLARDNNIDLATVRGSGPQGRILVEDVQKAIQQPAPGPSGPLADDNGARVPVVPAARRLARDNSIDLATVRGSGPQGRILIEDVEKAIAGQSVTVPAGETATAGAAPGGQVVPIEGIRRTIATRMLQSLQTMAQVTLTAEVNVTEAMILRRGLSRHQPEGSISPLHLVIRATAQGLKRHPRLNALQSEDHVQLMNEINIGVAVALEEGLVTPVIRNADTKPLAQLAAEGRDLASRTRDGRARPEEVTGGTFTITNLGANGIDGFTPIINPPQVAILGVGRVMEKPVISGEQIVKGSMMYLSLTFDHRIVDGAPAAEFLETVNELLEDPWWMVG